MRALLKQLYSPPFLVCFLTLAPFAIPFSDFLNGQTRGLSRIVGIDIGLFAYAVVCVLAFWLGYMLFIVGGARAFGDLEHREVSERATLKCRRRIVLAVLALLTVGSIILFYTVSSSYVEGLIQSAIAQEANPELRASPSGFIASESVPGILRMFDFSIVGSLILLYAVALASPRWLRGWRVYWILLLMSGLAMIVRSTIVLDRYPLLAALLLGIFMLIRRMRLTRTQLAATCIGIPLLLMIVSSFLNIAQSIRASENDYYNQILEYADFGVANASLAYRTTSQFGWGTGTLMGPITYVPRGLGINFEFPVPDSDWMWSPASNLLCISIREFWIFGFIIYLIYGAVMGRVMGGRKTRRESIVWAVGHLWCLWVLLSIWTEPVGASPSLWIAIFMTLIIGRYVDRLWIPTRRKGPYPASEKPGRIYSFES